MENNKWIIYLVVVVIFLAIIVYLAKKIPVSTQQGSTTASGGTNKIPAQLIETMGFDEMEVNADVAVITFRVQAFGPDELKARLEFLKRLKDIEEKSNDREIPFQLIPKSPEPFVFVQSGSSPPGLGDFSHPSMDLLHQNPMSPSRPKTYSITQDFSLPLLLSRSPPIPLFLDALASNGALISNISFPISAQRKSSVEKSSLLQAVADAKTKAAFLASNQQRTLGNIVEITPVQVKIEQVKDPNLDLLMGQLEEQQQKYQQQMKMQQLQPNGISNPYLYASDPLQQLMQQQGMNPTLPSSPMDPIRVFSSSLVPKKVLITTQVRVKFNSY